MANESRISVRSLTSSEDSGGAAGASSSFLRMLFIALIIMKMTKAMITKSMALWMNAPLYLFRVVSLTPCGQARLPARIPHVSSRDRIVLQGLLETTQIEAYDNRVMIARALTSGGVGIDVQDVDLR